ncbi:MAG: inositol monophosphatase [Rhizobiaceae bacterium]|nr:inositol monophosphatase [Rhizobiaceae bacterium]
MNRFDIDHLAAILRDAAREEILPRFRRLSSGDVRQKTSATDLVTEADEAAERFIMARCAEAFPSAVFVGEELVASDPSALALVGTSELAIVVDPIDGTANYAAGAPLFAVMAAVVAKGETVAGLIYDPMGDDLVVAEMGSGAFQRGSDGRSTRLAVAPAVPVAEMVGVASHTYLPQTERAAFLSAFSTVKILGNYRCAGHEQDVLSKSAE